MQGVNGCPVSGAGEAGGKADAGIDSPDILTLDEEQFFSSDEEDEEPSSHLHHLPVVSQKRLCFEGCFGVGKRPSRESDMEGASAVAYTIRNSILDSWGPSSGQYRRSSAFK